MNHANSNVSDGVESWVDVPDDDLVLAIDGDEEGDDNAPPDDARPGDDASSPGRKSPAVAERRLPSEGFIGDVRVGSGEEAAEPTDAADSVVEDEKNDTGAGTERCDDDASVKNDGDDDHEISGEQQAREGNNGVPAAAPAGTTEGTAWHNASVVPPSTDPSEAEEKAPGGADDNNIIAPGPVAEDGASKSASEPRPTEEPADGAKEPPQDREGGPNSVDPSLRHHSAAYLNAALESMERMRRLNLEVEFSDACAGFPVHHDRCVHCQREALREFLADPSPDEEGRGIGIGSLKLDGSRLRSFKNSMEEARPDGSRLRRLKSNVEETIQSLEETKLDGSRLRRFGSNVERFFSMSAPQTDAASESGNGDGGDDSSFAPASFRGNNMGGFFSKPAAAASGNAGGARESRNNVAEVKTVSLGSKVGGLFSKKSTSAADGSNGSSNKVAEVATMGFGSKVGGFLLPKSTTAVGRDGDARDDSSEATDATTHLTTKSSMSSTESTAETASTGSARTIKNNRAASGLNILGKAPRPCLTCGHPTCSRHASSTFSKNQISICQHCACLFELDFLVDVIASAASDADKCRERVDRLVDRYDRAKLLLVCAARHADATADALESRTARSNRIGAGSSATGMVSGITGAAGCAVLLFPPAAAAGVPLLVASLVFGGGASVVQSGDAAARYFSEPNRLAEKMVALHGMVLSLLRITEVLSYGLLRTHLGVNYSLDGLSEEGGDESKQRAETSQHVALAREINELLDKHGVSRTTAAVGGLQSAVTSGIVAAEVATASTRIVATGTRSMAASARFVPIAGGLLSAVCVVAEGRELKRTLERIGEGNPCAKAKQVRTIRDEINLLPDSSLIAAECQRVFELARKEKLKKAEKDNNARQELGDVGGGDAALNDVSQGDISDLIDVMETAAQVDGIEESAPIINLGQEPALKS